MPGNWQISSYVDEVYGPPRMEESLQLMQKVGVGYVDLRIVDGVHNFVEVSDDELDRLEERLDRYGLKVAALGSPFFMTSIHGDQPPWGYRHGFDLDGKMDYEEHLKLLPRAFEIADRFGIDNIRCFAFWRDHFLDEVFEELVDKLGRAAQMAEAAGHTLYLENEMSTLAGTGAELARILKAVNSPALTGIYDVGNAGRLGATVYPDDYEQLRGLVGHLHVKFERVEVTCGWPSPSFTQFDAVDTPWWEQTGLAMIAWSQRNQPIQGAIKIGNRTVTVNGRRTLIPASQSVNIDFRGLLRAMLADGYDGFIGIDSHYTGLTDIEGDVKRSIDDLRQLITEVLAEREAPSSA